MHSPAPANLSGRRKTTNSTAGTTLLQNLKPKPRKINICPLFAFSLVLFLAASLVLLTTRVQILSPRKSPRVVHSIYSSVSASNITSSHNSTESSDSPYHNWDFFSADYQEMKQNLKIFVYPDVYNTSSSFANIFIPYPKSSLFNSTSKLGNYFSEHAFKAALLQTSLVTQHSELAHFFFMPFSVNAMRNDNRLHSEAAISGFVQEYINKISSGFKFWNDSGGANHFYVYCHSVGREAASKDWCLYNNAIQVTCSSSYFQRFFVAHKDVALPQVWPRRMLSDEFPNRSKLVFFAGRVQNSRVRQELLALWSNDTTMDIYSGNPPFPYEDGFKQSKYCLHLKGYEVNTARISDAIHYGCIPVVLSNYYDLPFANVLDWSKFSIIVNQVDIASLKKILLSVPSKTYKSMYRNLHLVRRHFRWHETPESYDAFYMTAYQLWLRRGLQHIPY